MFYVSHDQTNARRCKASGPDNAGYRISNSGIHFVGIRVESVDWLRFTNSIKAVDSSGVIAASLAAMSASYSFLFLRSFSNKQPPDQCALSLQGKVLLIGRDFVGWYVSLEHRDYLRRWAKRKITSRR